MFIKPINMISGQSIENFDCDYKPINDFLKNSSLKEYENKIPSSHILIDDNEMLIGFYTIKVIYFDYSENNESHPYCLNLEYIAIDKDKQCKGLGSNLLRYIIKDMKDISDKIGVRILTVASVDDKVGWYEKLGFNRIEGHISNLMYFDMLNIN